MALLPVSADRVQLSTIAPVVTDAFVCGILRDAPNTVARAALSGGVQWSNGLLFTSLGQIVYVDATAGLPAGTQYINGLPISPAGALCVSSDAAVSYSNGLPFAANGALSATTSLAAGVAALMASFPGPAKIWLDPWDMATLQQDAAGTTPVTAAGDPIGRIMDKSGAANNATQATTTSRPLWQTTFAAFDGTDDSWATASIDFTSTDKVTVVAGIRKNSDASAGVVCELSPVISTNTGAFVLLAPASAAANLQFQSKGTTGVASTPSGIVAPITLVVSGQGDIAAPIVIARVNGVQSSSSSSQGTGTYGNYPLYIGSRGGSSVRFNGNLYGLIIIGRLLTPSELTLCEQYMAQQAGITL